MTDDGPSGADTTLGLLRKARGGDDDALNRLYARVLPAVKRWAHGRVPREARGVLDTDDLVQETLTKTLAHLKGLQTPRGLMRA